MLLKPDMTESDEFGGLWSPMLVIDGVTSDTQHMKEGFYELPSL